MKLRTIDVTILLILGLLCVARATWGIFKDINVKLSSANSVTGRVINSGIIQIDKATFKSKKYKTVFALTLENSDEKFAVERGTDVCNYLNSQIQPGDTVKVFYRQSTSEYNTFVFQIEKGQRTLADIKEYQKGQAKMIVLMYVFGFAILGGLLAWYLNEKKKSKLAATEFDLLIQKTYENR
ncbi:hypothetical protein FC093_23280 [Ilyomonas limi]|uniref:DUF3592 domain-containing protein n=1 Tax=Ilyomonas limi TaxID=2575867 RepID=A0A4U3KPN4_9BACT|nr:hypothetical protein [Ilyomonas limi]TKK64112.1 hypothetical protein FC093_23280 [Ilyomonas limi]